MYTVMMLLCLSVWTLFKLIESFVISYLSCSRIWDAATGQCLNTLVCKSNTSMCNINTHTLACVCLCSSVCVLCVAYVFVSFSGCLCACVCVCLCVSVLVCVCVCMHVHLPLNVLQPFRSHVYMCSISCAQMVKTLRYLMSSSLPMASIF